jgi:two-component system response regulator LytT
MNILIIEDETPALNRITKLVKDIDPNIRIIATADSIESACLVFATIPDIDLVLMDIELADGQSFDIFKQVEVYCPIIFTTAYDEFAIKAFKVNSIDYLLKPIDKMELEAALEKFKTIKQQGGSALIQNLIQQLTPATSAFKNRFLIKSGTKLISIATEDIAYFMAAEKIVTVWMQNGSKYIIDHTLEELESLLNPMQFFRLNRQCLSSIKAIKTVHTYFNGKLKIDIEPKASEEILVSRERSPDFKKWLGQ